jgi:predicted PhzF superfamily epimerase YddE/YHI9
MKFQLLLALALTLGLHQGAVAQDLTFETGMAVNRPGHVAAKATKETTHGTTAVEVRKTGHAVKKGVDGFGHGVEKGATKTADVLK